MTVQRYPLDFEALEKDSWIETEKIREIYGVKPEDKTWGLAVVDLVSKILAHRQDLGAFSIQNRIRIPTDFEWSQYCDRRMRHHVRGTARVAAYHARTDTSELTPEQRQFAESGARISQAVAMAARQALRRQAMIEGQKPPRLVSGD